MEFKISLHDFADKLGKLYSKYQWGFKTLAIYYLKNAPYITAELGLKFVQHYYKGDIITLVFKITDEKKWMLTKIKYGI